MTRAARLALAVAAGWAALGSSVASAAPASEAQVVYSDPSETCGNPRQFSLQLRFEVSGKTLKITQLNNGAVATGTIEPDGSFKVQGASRTYEGKLADGRALTGSHTYTATGCTAVYKVGATLKEAIDLPAAPPPPVVAPPPTEAPKTVVTEPPRRPVAPTPTASDDGLSDDDLLDLGLLLIVSSLLVVGRRRDELTAALVDKAGTGMAAPARSGLGVLLAVAVVAGGGAALYEHTPEAKAAAPAAVATTTTTTTTAPVVVTQAEAGQRYLAIAASVNQGQVAFAQTTSRWSASTTAAQAQADAAAFGPVLDKAVADLMALANEFPSGASQLRTVAGAVQAIDRRLGELSGLDGIGVQTWLDRYRADVRGLTILANQARPVLGLAPVAQ